LPAAVEEEEGDDGGSKEEGETKEPQKPLVFEIHGNQFENRAADRANKKFKWRGIDWL